MDTVDWKEEALAHAYAAGIWMSPDYLKRNATVDDRVLVDGLPVAGSTGYDVVDDVVVVLRLGCYDRPIIEGRTNTVTIGNTVNVGYTLKGEAMELGRHWVQDTTPYILGDTVHERITLRRV